ncbi:hypothetical protein PBRA_000622 [Plasmodiophora brassicae]|uniref:DUF7932 domain-containing protein n=1 Tax=Plasmodiophora brassicae TaxID=37360 RepID=A0A0G4IPZ1_PLABS|nr:hypothetical protein PBRA_000622 [Plasmodiophora brassicae]
MHVSVGIDQADCRPITSVTTDIGPHDVIVDLTGSRSTGRVVHGANGKPGRHGSPDGHRCGEPGGQGGDGVDGLPGYDAPPMHITLTWDGNRCLRLAIRKGVDGSLGTEHRLATLPDTDGRIVVLAAGLDGSNGGNGGKGGDGGDGCDLTTTDDASRSDAPRGGDGGRGGAAGRGGDGGAGANLVVAAVDPALLMWIRVIDLFNRIVQSGPTLFNPVVSFYELHDADDDGVFEPGTDIEIRGIVLRNTGSLTLPPCVLAFEAPSCDTSGAVMRLPAISPHQEYALDAVLNARLPSITDDDCTPNAHYAKRITLTPVVSLCGVRFAERSPQAQIVSQFPIKLDVVSAATVLGDDELGEIRLRITNVSPKIYGRDFHGDVEVHVQLGPGLLFHRTKADDYDLINPHVARHSVRHAGTIAPSELVFTVKLARHLAALPYASTCWTAMLQLRGVRIEEIKHDLRSVPAFDPSSRADVLLVTPETFTRQEYLEWCVRAAPARKVRGPAADRVRVRRAALLTRLGLSCSVWDLQRYGSLSGEDTSWIGRVQNLIIASGTPSADLRAVLSLQDMAAHLQQPNSGMLCLGYSSAGLDAILFDFDGDPIAQSAPPRLPWRRFGAAERACRKVQRREPQFLHRAAVVETPGETAKPSDPHLHVYRCVVPRTARLIVIESPVFLEHSLPIANDGERSSGTIVYPWFSSYSIATFAILALMSVGHKLDLLERGTNDDVAIACDRNRSGTKQTRVGMHDLVHLAILQEIQYEFKSKNLTFPACTEFVAALRQSPERFSVHGATILVALQRHIDRTRWASFPWCTGMTSTRRNVLIGLRDQLVAVIDEHGHLTSCLKEMKQIATRTPPYVQRLFMRRMHQIWLANWNRADALGAVHIAGRGPVTPEPPAPPPPETIILQTTNSMRVPDYYSR